MTKKNKGLIERDTGLVHVWTGQTGRSGFITLVKKFWKKSKKIE